MTAMPTPDTNSRISALPAILREPVRRWFQSLAEQQPERNVSGVDIATLVHLVASSEFAGRMLLREWPWFHSQVLEGVIDHVPDSITVANLARETLRAGDAEHLKSRLRRFRNQQMLHILWRTSRANGSASILAETLGSLSNLADTIVASSVFAAEQLLAPRFGVPLSDTGEKIPLVTLAMGKLGGRELNFSSDIDLIFIYPQDGESNGDRKLSAHEYFVRLVQQVVALLDDVTADGFVFRVDTRLRPFGASGPPVVSFQALETYLLQHGRGWERYAYIKARPITPVNAGTVVDDLNSTMIEPFVYRRYLDYGVFESLRDMKALISAEVHQRKLANNIKLGPGGIREIEFIVQSLQLVRGGADEQLRCRELLVVLPRLGKGKGISPASAELLLEAYNFLRRLENAMQAIRDQQTHELPQDPLDKARLQVALCFPDWPVLMDALDKHRATVSRLFAEVAFRTSENSSQSELAASLARNWDTASDASDWTILLKNNAYSHAEALAATIVQFAALPAIRQIDSTSNNRLAQFVPALLGLLRDRPEPHIVCERVLNIAARILRRSAYIALLNENPAALHQLVTLCERSAYLADEIARFPLLLDEMLDPRQYADEITSASLRDDLTERLLRARLSESEQQIEMLAQFQRASLFRIAVADFNGRLPIMKVSDRLTDLAEVVLQRALDIAWSDLVEKHGAPYFNGKHGMQAAGLGVIAYGKMGGMELSYRSDLDLVFLHDSEGDAAETDGAKPLENSMFFSRLVRRLVHFLTTQTGSGVLYEVDTRLRPSGHSGLLVVSVEGFERYQEENAWTWEHQALLRARPVAGSSRISQEFDRIRTETLRNRVRRDRLLDDVLSMRVKMRDQLDKSDTRHFDLKQGEGGIGDIEFLVQYLVLRHAQEHAAVVHYSDNIRQLGTLGAAGCLPPADVARLQQAYRDYRLHLHRLTLNDESPLVPVGQFMEEREFVVAVWQREMVEA
jgi:glutamate-ammonia-ligase adenylyltransferase